MALSDRLAIVITANGSQAVGEFNRVGRAAGQSLGQAEARSQRLGATLTRTGAAMVTFGAVALVGLYQLARAAEEQTRAELQLQNTISRMPELAGASSAAFIEQAEALQQVTVADDAAIVSAQAMLGTFHLTASEIETATPLVLDYARKFGVDLVTAAKQVGKALQGNIGTLQRNGVMIDQNAYATDRFGAVMDALRENAGGFAEAEGATFSGRLEIMKNQLGEVAEGVGVGVVDAFSSLLGVVQGASGAFASLDPNVQSTMGRLATFASVGLVASGGLSLITGSVMRMAGQLSTAGSKIVDFGLAVATMSAAAGVATAGGLVVLAGVVMAYRNAAQRAAEQTEAFTEALEAQAAGDHDAVYQEIASQISDLVPTMDRAGVSVQDVAAAVKDQGDAWEQLQAQRDAARLDGGETSGEFMAINEIVNQVDAMRDGYSSANEEIAQTAEAQAALGITTDGATAAMEAQQAALDELSAALEAFFTQTFGVERATDDVVEAQQKLFESLVENGPLLSGTSAGALANRDAFDGWATSIGAAAEALIQNGGSAQQAALYIDQQREALARARDMGLISSSTFQRYSGILDGIRSEVTTTAEADTETAQQEIDTFIQRLNAVDGRRVGAVVDLTVNNGGLLGFAGGTRSAPRGLAVVGEEGPELVNFRGGESVMTAGQTAALARDIGRASTAAPAAGGPVFNVTVNAPSGDGDDIARKVMREIRRLERGVAA